MAPWDPVWTLPLNHLVSMGTSIGKPRLKFPKWKWHKKNHSTQSSIQAWTPSISMLLKFGKGPSGYSSRFGRGETGASWCLTPRLAIFPQEIMIQQEITENLLVSRNRHADFRQTNRLDLCWVPGKTPDSCWQPLWPWSTLQFCSKNSKVSCCHFVQIS